MTSDREALINLAHTRCREAGEAICADILETIATTLIDGINRGLHQAAEEQLIEEAYDILTPAVAAQTYYALSAVAKDTAKGWQKVFERNLDRHHPG